MRRIASFLEPLEARIAPALIYALDGANHLLSFDSQMPETILSNDAITGLTAGVVLKAMDFRPATGDLYAVAVTGASAPFTGQLYKISVESHAATKLASTFSTSLSVNSGLDLDFDPTTDRVRFTNGGAQNLLINPVSGALIENGAAFTNSDVTAGLAYSNNYPGTANSTLYAIDYNNDNLLRIGPLNGTGNGSTGIGTLIGGINVSSDANARDLIGFDIFTGVEGNTAFYALPLGGSSQLATLELTTGAPQILGVIGTGAVDIFDIAVAPSALNFTPGKTFSYTDGDGDRVTVKTSAGVFSPDMLTTLGSLDGKRFEILKLDLKAAATFTGAKISITAKKTAAGGDGHADLGYFFGGGVDLGSFSIPGNLQAFNVGTGGPGKALKSLTADSFSVETPGSGGGPSSNFNGPVGSVLIKGDIINANLTFPLGVQTFTLGGTLHGVADVSGGIGSGTVDITGYTSISVGGIIGSASDASGRLFAHGTGGTVKVKGNIFGSAGVGSGYLLVEKAASVSVSGSILGGAGFNSGQLILGEVTSAKVGHSVIGSLGGGAIQTTARVGSIAVGGDLVARGSTSGGTGAISGVEVGKLSIGGGVYGLDGATATIAFSGEAAPDDAADAVAIGTLSVGKSINRGQVLAGGTTLATLMNFDVAVGKITIGGDFIASNISVGYVPGDDGFFGNGDFEAGSHNVADVSAAIASLTIKGKVRGTIVDGDHFGIVAETLGPVTIGGRKITGPSETADILLSTTGDVRLRAYHG